MAQPTTARPGKMRILLGDGADPEVFSAPCGLTSKSLNIQKNFNEEPIPDCDDPDAPYWLTRDVQSLSASVSGEGLYAAEADATWMDATISTEAVNAKVEIEFSTGTRTFEGAFHVTASPQSDNGTRIKVAVDMQSDGQITTSWVAA